MSWNRAGGHIEYRGFAKPISILERAEALAERAVRGDIAHRLSTTVRNLIAFFG